MSRRLIMSRRNASKLHCFEDMRNGNFLKKRQFPEEVMMSNRRFLRKSTVLPVDSSLLSHFVKGIFLLIVSSESFRFHVIETSYKVIELVL